MTENKNTPQEIDLIELFSRMGNGISNLFSKFFNLIGKIILWIFIAGKESLKFSLKNFHILLAFALLGIVAGKFQVKRSQPYYRTNATIQTFTVSSSNLIEYTNTLSTVCQTSDSIALSQMLNISVSEAASIKSIDAYWLIDKNKDGVADEVDYENMFEPDTINTAEKINDRFLVQLLIYHPEYIDTIQNKFEAFLHTYPRLEQITAVKRRNLESEIKRINSELTILDSLKYYEYFIKDKERMEKNVGVIPFDKILLSTTPEEEPPTRLLHDVTLGLETKNHQNITALELNTEPFRFISKFVPVNNPVNVEKEEKVSIKYLATSLLLGLLFALLWRNRKEILQFIKE
jgi:hypothetical protein